MNCNYCSFFKSMFDCNYCSFFKSMFDSKVSRFDSKVSGLQGCEESLSDSRDRLSELPDSLIHEILSLLPMKDVVKTTLLSKRWKDLWTTVPCLDFSNIPTDNDLFKFRSFVCEVLGHWKGVKIRKLSLSLWRYFDSFASDIYDSWLFFSVGKQVEDLNIDFKKYLSTWDIHSVSTDYYVPQFVHSCSSMKKLSLVSCKLNIDKNVQWNQLKSLTIEGLEPLSVVSLNHILSGAPHLEVLNLTSSFVVNRENLIINIESTCLKMLKIRTVQPKYMGSNDAMLKIRAPNLDTLDISGLGYRMFGLDLDVPSLTTAILDFHDVYMRLQQILRRILHVRKLTLSYTCIFYQSNSTVLGAEPLSETVLSNFVSGAPNLEVLNLSLDNRQDMNIQSTSLKILKINSSPYTRPDYYTMLGICAPNLETLEISGFPNRKLLNAPSLTNAILGLDRDNTVLREMLWTNSPSLLIHVEKVTLSHWYCTEVLLKMKKYKKIQSNAKFLKLIHFSAPIKILGVVEMFPQLTMLVIECNQEKPLRLSGDQLDAMDTRRSCPLLQYLKTVEITWPINDPSIYHVIEILLKNARRLEKMVFRPFTVSPPVFMVLAENKVRRMPISSPTAELIFINK